MHLRTRLGESEVWVETVAPDSPYGQQGVTHSIEIEDGEVALAVLTEDERRKIIEALGGHF